MKENRVVLTLTFELVVPHRIDLPLLRPLRRLALGSRRLDGMRVKIRVQPSQVAVADERVPCQMSVERKFYPLYKNPKFFQNYWTIVPFKLNKSKSRSIENLLKIVCKSYAYFQYLNISNFKRYLKKLFLTKRKKESLGEIYIRVWKRN